MAAVNGNGSIPLSGSAASLNTQTSQVQTPEFVISYDKKSAALPFEYEGRKLLITVQIPKNLQQSDKDVITAYLTKYNQNRLKGLGYIAVTAGVGPNTLITLTQTEKGKFKGIEKTDTLSGKEPVKIDKKYFESQIKAIETNLQLSPELKKAQIDKLKEFRESIKSIQENWNITYPTAKEKDQLMEEKETMKIEDRETAVTAEQQQSNVNTQAEKHIFPKKPFPEIPSKPKIFNEMKTVDKGEILKDLEKLEKLRETINNNETNFQKERNKAFGVSNHSPVGKELRKLQEDYYLQANNPTMKGLKEFIEANIKNPYIKISDRVIEDLEVLKTELDAQRTKYNNGLKKIFGSDTETLDVISEFFIDKPTAKLHELYEKLNSKAQPTNEVEEFTNDENFKIEDFENLSQFAEEETKKQSEEKQI